MPFINTITTKEISKEKKNELTRLLGEAIALIHGKSERWLMLKFEGGADMAFSGDSERDCAMVEVELFGEADKNATGALTKRITEILRDELDIPTERIYVKYFGTRAWGYDGENL